MPHPMFYRQNKDNYPQIPQPLNFEVMQKNR